MRGNYVASCSLLSDGERLWALQAYGTRQCGQIGHEQKSQLYEKGILY